MGRTCNFLQSVTRHCMIEYVSKFIFNVALRFEG
jgi:hypothetical protein